MGTRVTLTSIARFSAGVIALIWGLLGLTDALAAGTGRGTDIPVIVEAVVNGALIAAAVLTLLRTHYWRLALIVAIFAVTADRIVQVAGAGDWWLAASSIAMLLAIVGISSVARRF